MLRLFAIIGILIMLVISSGMNAREVSHEGLPLVDYYLSNNQLDSAEHEIKRQIDILLLKEEFDSLVHYVGKLGKIEKHFTETASESLELAKKIENNTNDNCTRFILNRELASIFFDRAKIQKAYDYALKAKFYAGICENKEASVEIEYHLGDYSLKLGNVKLFKQHIRQAHLLIKSKPNMRFKIAARVYNYMGAVMYFSSEQDSALLYFTQALEEIPGMDKNAESQLYLPASIKGNMFLIKLNQGKHDDARTLVEESIHLNKRFLNETINHPLKPRVLRNTSIAYTNLTSLYFNVGDYRNADRITQISYRFTKKYFPPKTEEYFIATLPVAEVKIALMELSEALKYLNKARACLDKMDGENLQWNAYINNIFGTVYFKMNESQKALDYFENSDSYYSKSNEGEYSINRLRNAMNLAKTYARLQNKEKAIFTAEKAYAFLSLNQGKNESLINLVLVTLARVSYEVGDYEACLNWCKESLQIFEKYEEIRSVEKLQFEEFKAEVILLHTKSEYALSENAKQLVLEKLLKEMRVAIQVLEDQKMLVTDQERVNSLIESNREVYDFTKKLSLDLYKLTNSSQDLRSVVSLHESALYNRIRARLNVNSALLFNDVPSGTIERENLLRQRLSFTTEEIESESAAIQRVMDDEKNWDQFLDSLRTAYPKYYNMRYASIEQSLSDLSKSIPIETSIVRYFFVEDNLFAYVFDSTEESIVSVDYSKVIEHIDQLNNYPHNVDKMSTLLHELYEVLWRPFEEKIRNKRVIIIPDGELFNLSFEMLTPKPINAFVDLAHESLLSKYSISYNYSLYLLDATKELRMYRNNFIAFAPGFTDEMKANYQLSIQDSSSVDGTYLRLLPQPFSTDLAEKYSKRFRGSMFLNENSTVQVFKNQANEHKIIHIGTHAESNNISPELSRLIFAKSTIGDSLADNSLYSYQIFNMNLNSELAILTGCETGKPGYQAGEGMISLANAFNYAGSKSLVTSLWNIDEQSSTRIMDFFYSNLSKGLAKDEALRLAKLSYIAESKGRIAAPQYWAGLVLIGDVSSIEISKTRDFVYAAVGILCLLILVLIYTRKRFLSKNQ